MLIDENLGYVLGVLCGDGYTNSQRGAIGLTASDKDFVNAFGNKIKNYTGEELHFTEEERKVENWSKKWRVEIYSREWSNFFSQFKLKQKNWEVPECIFNSNEEIICSFLRGFYDSEGHCEIWENRGSNIRITNSNQEGLKDVKELLETIGIENNISIYKTEAKDGRVWHRLVIGNLDDKHNFTKKVGSLIDRKRKDLEKIKDEYKNCEYRSYTKKEIQFLKNNYKDMTCKEMAKNLQRSEDSIKVKKSSLGLVE